MVLGAQEEEERDESGCEEEEGREDEDEDSGSEESLVDSDSDPDEKGVYAQAGAGGGDMPNGRCPGPAVSQHWAQRNCSDPPVTRPSARCPLGWGQALLEFSKNVDTWVPELPDMIPPPLPPPPPPPTAVISMAAPNPPHGLRFSVLTTTLCIGVWSPPSSEKSSDFPQHGRCRAGP